MQIQKYQHKNDSHIYNGHHRNHLIGDFCNFTDSAERDISRHCDEQQGYHIVKYRSALKGSAGGDFHHLSDGADYVKTLGGKTAHGINDIHQGKCYPGPKLVAQQNLPIKRKPAYEFILFPFFKNLGQYGLRIGGSHSEKSGNPHPEQRAGPADCNGSRYSENISRPHSHGGTQEKSSQG